MTEPANESGLGFFLKKERERKGLSPEQLARITKLRIQYVEALENEDWGRLPSPVFIRGFIKSYTKALGLDFREVMGQFHSSIPVHDDLPRPLVPPGKTNAWKSAVFIAVGLVIVVLLVLFVLVDPISYLKKAGNDQKEVVRESTVQEQGYDVRDRGGQAAPAQPVETVEAPPIEQTPDSTTGAGIGSTDIGITTARKAETAPAEAVTAVPVETQSQTAVEEPAPVIMGRYALTAYVTGRTYIKIYVDNNPPKEYIFSPGSYPQWTGDEGFFLLIGNAAGVEFNFNGQIIKDLGDEGDVVRLRLPEDFNLNINE